MLFAPWVYISDVAIYTHMSEQIGLLTDIESVTVDDSYRAGCAYIWLKSGFSKPHCQLAPEQRECERPKDWSRAVLHHTALHFYYPSSLASQLVLLFVVMFRNGL